jgi:hypothetical protein
MALTEQLGNSAVPLVSLHDQMIATPDHLIMTLSHLMPGILQRSIT